MQFLGQYNNIIICFFSTKDKFFLRFHYDDNDAFNLLFVLYNNNNNNNGTKVIIIEGLTELNVS